jgi:oligopeptide transport system substrate-binding protein
MRPTRRSLLLSALASFGVASHAAAQPPPQIWYRGSSGDPGSLDPHKTSTVIEGDILNELYEGLVTRGQNGEIIAGVADTWSIDAAKTVYRFHFRADARWSNGDRVSPQDFVFAFQRLMKPQTGAQYANILYTLKNAERVNKGELPVEELGVRAIGEDRLELTLERPVPYLLEQLTHLTALPLHRPSVERFGDQFARPGRMVGNGAFVLRDFVPNDRLALAKNPQFHKAGDVALDAQIFIPFEDRAAALRRFMAGEIHSYDDVPVDQIAFVRSRIGDQFKCFPSLASYYFAFDTRHPPFDDGRVRRALAMVVDREFLARRIWGGTMEPSYSFVPPGIESYGAPSHASWKDDDPFTREDAAKKLLQEAGFGPGGKVLTVEIRFNTSENHKATAVAIADMWRVLGVETRLLQTDATSHYAYLYSKAPFDIARSGWFADFADAENFLFLGESGNKSLNVANFVNPTFDAFMRAAREASEASARSALLHKAEAILLEEQPYLVLLSFQSRNLVSKRLRGWDMNVLNVHPGRFVSVEPLASGITTR